MLFEIDTYKPMKKTIYTLLAFGTLAFIASVTFSSCTKGDPDSPGFEFMPDMYRSPSIESNGANLWVKDSSHIGNMLPPVGTIPLEFIPFPYPNTVLGDSLASLLWKSPLEISDLVEAKGQVLYEQFCIYCHGTKGEANGQLVESGKYTAVPPSYITKYKEGALAAGHVYHVLTYGKGNMGSHASLLSPNERWEVIQYVQRLGRGGDAWSVYQKKLFETPAVDSVKKNNSAKLAIKIN